MLVVWALASMVVLGLLFAVGLMLAARAFHVDQDPRVEAALQLLPGVNCGGCGFAGCSAYAGMVVQGEKVTLCTAGGPDVAQALAELMGVEVGEMVRRRAVVHCQGGRVQCGERFHYVGEHDCRAAQLVAGGHSRCTYGCLGLGSCAAACPYDAITMNANALPVIDAEKCTACGACVRTCPRNLISLLEVQYKIYLGCSVHERGKSVKDICSVGCIACGLCVKNDPHKATELVDLLPVLDYEKAGGDFAAGARVCPQNCFVVEDESLLEPVGAAGQAPEQA